MIALNPSRKNKIQLTDYNFRKDIELRILLSDLSAFDVDVLKELIFSPLKTSFRKLAKALSCREVALDASLQKLTALVERQDDALSVDKEKRKYFEFQISRFDEAFRPDVEFMQGLLKKVPIHLLPAWYATPRTSNNIFESIIEKYLITPQVFQRYLHELNLGDPLLNGLIKDLFAAPNLKLSTSDAIAKYNLKREEFEEAMLILEFNFIACLSYEQEDEHWHEFIVPFNEWREYLLFIQKTETPPVTDSMEEKPPFAFIEKMSNELLQVRKKEQPITCQKLLLLNLVEEKNGKALITHAGESFLDLSIENKALYLYRHPQNRLLSHDMTYVREAEKAVKRVLHGKWVRFDDFFKGVLVPLNDHSSVSLKKVAKKWQYVLPSYGTQEKELMHAVIFEWLYEMGITETCRDCFRLSPFGRFFFED